MDKPALKKLIKRYEDVYLFATKNIAAIFSEQVLEDLSLEQFGVLRQLALKGPLRSSDLAEATEVNKSAITSKIDRLAAKKLVNRIRDERDRRNVYIEITAAGMQIYIQGQERIESFVASLLEELSNEELESFITLYEKITQIIEKQNGGRISS